MKATIFGILFLLSTTAMAGDCERNAKDAKGRGIRYVVFSFEGLASYLAGFVRNNLVESLPGSYQQRFVAESFAYTGDDQAVRCLRDYQAVFGKSAKFVVIGHSFGGGIAVPNFLDKLSSSDELHAVITLDPRSWTSDSIYSRSKDLFVFQPKLKPTVRIFLNFFQRGSMPGYKVKGAVNVPINDSNHVGMPANQRVHHSVEEILSAL
jgi:hypothetical protein